MKKAAANIETAIFSIPVLSRGQCQFKDLPEEAPAARRFLTLGGAVDVTNSEVLLPGRSRYSGGTYLSPTYTSTSSAL